MFKYMLMIGLFLAQVAFSAPKLQNSDFATPAQITGAGGTIAQLLNTSNIYDDVDSVSLDTQIAIWNAKQAAISTSSAPANQFTNGFTSPNTFTYAQPSFSNLSGNITNGQLPTYTNHGVILGTGAAGLSVTSVGATNTVLHGNTGADPTYSAIVNADITNATIDLTSKVTGILPYANGGTNASTSWTQGSVMFAGASSLAQDNSNFFWDATNHRLGIGTATPGVALTVLSGGTGNLINGISTAAQSTTSGGVITVTENNGSAMTANNRLGNFSFNGNDGTSANTGAASIRGFATQTWTSSAHGSRIALATTPNGSTTTGEGLSIEQDKTIIMPAYGTGVCHFDSTGLISSSTIVNADIAAATINLTTKVTGVLPIANVAGGRTLNTQSGTTYTFALADGLNAGGLPLTQFTSGSAVTVTVPTNASVAFAVGDEIDFSQEGAGKVTISPAGGVTVNSLGANLSAGGQYVGLALVKTATNVWTLYGNLIP